MKNTLLLSMVLLSCYISIAQNKISGTVTGSDNLPLQGVSVYIPDMKKGTETNTKGFYELQNLPNGKIKIWFSMVGYENIIETIELKNESKILNINLNATEIEMEEIVISGGYHSTQHDNAVKIDVLKLDVQNIKNTPNFTEMLTKIPGVDMISKGSGISKPVIRGLSMNDILILNHGVRIENYQYSSHHPLGIDEFGIENVEVIKGPASLLYGSDAIGGVINFIKAKPLSVGTIAGDYNLQLFSNTLGITQNLGINGSSDKFFGGIRMGQKSNSDFLQGGGQFVPNSRFNEASVKANVGFTNSTGTFNLYYDYNQQKLGLVEDEAIESISARERINKVWYQELNTHILSSQNKLYWGNYKLALNSGFQQTALTHFGDENIYEIQMQLSTLTYEAKLHLPSTKKSEYIVGFQGLNQKNTNLNNRETKLLPEANTNNYSVFSLLQFSLFEKLKWQTGVRYDTKSIVSQAIGLPSAMDYRPALDKNYNSFSGSLGATYEVSKTLLLRSNFAAAYRTPNLAELTSNGQHELRYEMGNANLVPENAYETDASLHYHKDNVTFDIAAFYNAIQNYIFIAPTSETTADGLEIYQYKQHNAHLLGGEAGMHFHPKTINGLHFETTFSWVKGQQTNGVFLPFVPAPKISFELRAESDKLLFLNDVYASVYNYNAFKQNHTATDETPTSGYSLFDFNIGGKIKLNHQYVSLGISINNIFDIKYIDHLSTLKEANFFNPGRNVTLVIKVPFGIVPIKK